MTETRTPYTTNAPQPQRLVVTLTVDIADAAIAAYLTDRVQASPPVTRQGFDPQSMDRAMLDAFLDAAGPPYLKSTETSRIMPPTLSPSSTMSGSGCRGLG